MRIARYSSLILIISAITCLSGPVRGQAQNTLSEEEKGQGFKLLFDGTMQSVRDNFVAYQKDGSTITTLPANIQAAADGAHFFDNGATQDIRTKVMFDDFELRADYRVSDNAGIFYRAALLTGSIFENAIEYPLYNGTPDAGNWNAPGAAYDIYPPSVNNYKSYGTGEWNTVRIRLFKDSAYHWHNGIQVVKYSFLSSDYLSRKVARKWANVPCVAVEAASQNLCDHGNPYRKTGFIGFQTGYPGQLYLRNLKIAKYPFTIPVKIGESPSPASPSRLSATPTTGVGLTLHVEAGTAYRLKIHRADGSLLRAITGDGRAEAHHVHTPVTGRHFLRFESASGIETRHVTIP